MLGQSCQYKRKIRRTKITKNKTNSQKNMNKNFNSSDTEIILGQRGRLKKDTKTLK